jgi:hypothetical protein
MIHETRTAITTAAHLALDAAAGIGVLCAFASLVSLVIHGWQPLSFWWMALATLAAAAALICWTAMLLSSHRQTLRWAALCGIIAGMYAWAPWMTDPSPAAVCRVLLPLAVRRALRLESRIGWYLAIPIAIGALGLAGDLVKAAALAAALWSIGERVLSAPRIRLRFASGLAACMALPAALALLNAAGLPIAEWLARACYLAIATVVIYAATQSADIIISPYQETLPCPRPTALPPPQ